MKNHGKSLCFYFYFASLFWLINYDPSFDFVNMLEKMIKWKEKDNGWVVVVVD